VRFYAKLIKVIPIQKLDPMNNAILTMARSSRIVEPLTKGVTNQRLFFSYGQTIPELSDFATSYWMGGAFALKLRRIGLASRLVSPGATWLPELPVSLTGRTIHEGDLEAFLAYDAPAWVKPSEAKIVSIPAGIYSSAQIQEKFHDANFTHAISLQWTETVMSMNHEHRFFVADSKVITGSPYLVDGEGYHPGISYARYEEAKTFAQHVLDEVETPPAFTLDVAFDEHTQKWVVIEGNRAWSSGFYGADPVAALETVRLSCNAEDDVWLWEPDEHILQLETEQLALSVISVEDIENQVDVFEFSKPTN
jgi:hypothetical protein